MTSNSGPLYISMTFQFMLLSLEDENVGETMVYVIKNLTTKNLIQ